MRVGSLFSGVGGFDLGLERVGHSVRWQVEKDAQCRTILAKHWPDVDLFEDVCNVGAAELSPVDLICGGFPCQDLSVAGRRAGLDGDRSGLWHEFRRIVSELRPTWVLVENVPGLLSSNGGSDLWVVLRGLADIGYVGAWRVLDSQFFGVAQRRKRVFLLATRDPGAGCPSEVLAIPEGLSGHPAPSREARAGVAPLLEIGARTSGDGYRDGDGIGHDGDPMYTLQAGKQHGVAALTANGVGTCGADDNQAQAGHIVSHPITAREAKGPDSGMTNGTVVTHTLRAEGHDASEDGTGRGVRNVIPYDTTQITSGANRSNPKAGDPCHPLSAGAHAPSIITTVPRRLTPTECSRLQGFPDDWLDGLSDSAKYRALGNAVTVNVAEWIGRRLMAIETEAE